jgi:hypothetical protein
MDTWTDDLRPVTTWPYFQRRYVGVIPQVSVNGGPGQTWDQLRLEDYRRRVQRRLQRDSAPPTGPPACYPSVNEYRLRCSFPARLFTDDGFRYVGLGPIPYCASGIDQAQSVVDREKHRQVFFQNKDRAL